MNQQSSSNEPNESGAVSRTGNPAVDLLLAEPKSSTAAFWNGICLGALLNVVMIGALVAANRIPKLEPYALERNAASYGLFILLLLIPIIRFLKRPAKMFTAGVIGWSLFVVGYDFAGLYFHNLFAVLRTPLEALVEGCVVFGVAAVISWVAGMMFHARRYSIASRRRLRHNLHRHY
jgi:hypothetical protein